MRDRVADERFLRRKKIEAHLNKLYPAKFIPQYTLVTFSDDVPFSEAQRVGREQDAIMQELMEFDEVYNDWTSEAERKRFDAVMSGRADLEFAPVSPR